eukprot:gene6638-13448_t
MRLLTFNTLKCAAKSVQNGYPLLLSVVEMKVQESAFNPVFIKHIVPSLDWSAIVSGAKAVGFDELPPNLDPSYLEDENFLRAAHHLLLDIHVMKGVLTCPESGREFPIEDGIPNMMLTEAEA